MKFRKRPIVIEAEQWFPDKPVNGVERYLDGNKEYGIIETLEGGFIVKPGDWIITGVKGEKYSCKPDIFEETYEKVDDTLSIDGK